MNTDLKPITSQERILAIDILRGFAILGILIMNIQSFAMPGAAYLNPTSFGDLTGSNYWVWTLSHIFADQKFMTLFSLLYGAGILIVTQGAENKTGRSAGLHYRRTFWLLLFGLAHAHLIWYGDILVAYAICAVFAYLFRKKKPKTQLIVGVLLIAVHTVFYGLVGISLQHAPEEAAAGALESWAPTPDKIEEEIAIYTGGYGPRLAKRSESAFFMETFVFLMLFIWRAGGLMLIGMSLYQWGIISGKRTTKYYTKGLIIALLVGLPIIIIGLIQNFKAAWSVQFSMFLGSQFNYWGSLFVAFAYICIIMLFAGSNIGSWLKDRLAAVGQMALTNYLTQSIICTFIFYGSGFGLFGQVSRTEQIGYVIGVWLLQLLWSHPWLNHFKYGPFEWAWRSLTYLKIQPMKK